MTELQKQEDLIERLIKSMDENDANYKKAKDFGFVESIKNLFLGCYDYKEMCVWLCEHNNNLFHNFRYAVIQSQEDFDSMEDFEEAKMDSLMVSDDGEYICRAW